MFFFLLLSIGSLTAFYQSNKSEVIVKDEVSKQIEAPFGIDLVIDKIDDDQYNFGVTIQLEKGSYVISPFSNDDIYGHFEISIDENKNFLSDKTLLEIPSSVEEMDPIIKEKVKFVRVNTTYKQKVQRLSKNDFEVAGLIEFVLEPSCIPYDVEFVISNRSGKMEVEKTKTSISKEYKGK